MRLLIPSSRAFGGMLAERRLEFVDDVLLDDTVVHVCLHNC